MCKLYSFVDLTANWTALFAFLIINIAIIGGLINRKTKKIDVFRHKSFVPASIVTTLIISISLIMEIIKSFGNLYLSIAWYHDVSHAQDRLIGSILMLIIMFLFMFVLFYPTLRRKNIEVQQQ
jgi:hypothetical protein